MPSFSALGKFFGRTASDAAGFAAGSAVADTLRPELQIVTNESWALNTTKRLDVAEVARGIAQKLPAGSFAPDEAHHTGWDDTRLAALVELALRAPGLAQVYDAWRRGEITDADVEHAFAKDQIEPQYWPALKGLKDMWLSPQELAVMVQRGIVANDGLLPVGPPTATGKVPPMPQINIDPIHEAAGAGINGERLAGLARIIGLPASPDLAARMTFRGIIDRVDFDRAISEGNTRNEWAPFLFEGFRQILTAHDYIEGQLRDWITPQEMYAGTSKHGMSQADTDLLFKVTGRPINYHQVFIGLRRGGTYDGPTDQIDPAALKSMRESNIRPEWYNLAWAQHFTLPSLFFIRTWLKDGHDEAVARDWLWKLGYEQVDIDRIVVTLAPAAAGAPVKPKKLTNTTIRAAFRKGEIVQADALARLEANGLSAADALLYLDA